VVTYRGSGESGETDEVAVVLYRVVSVVILNDLGIGGAGSGHLNSKRARGCDTHCTAVGIIALKTRFFLFSSFFLLFPGALALLSSQRSTGVMTSGTEQST